MTSATDELRRLLDEFEQDLCHAGCGVKASSYNERRAMIDAVKGEYAQAIAATLGGIEEPDTIRNELTDSGLIDTRAELVSEREKALGQLVSDLWQGHDCGAGCAVYEECRHPLDDRCPMEERVAELGNGTCEMEYGGDLPRETARALGVYFCSECGSPTYNDCMPYFCGYCGKAVKR